MTRREKSRLEVKCKFAKPFYKEFKHSRLYDCKYIGYCECQIKYGINTYCADMMKRK